MILNEDDLLDRHDQDIEVSEPRERRLISYGLNFSDWLPF